MWRTQLRPRLPQHCWLSLTARLFPSTRRFFSPRRDDKPCCPFSRCKQEDVRHASLAANHPPSRMYARSTHTHTARQPPTNHHNNNKLQPGRTDGLKSIMSKTSHTLMGGRQRLLCSEGSSGVGPRDPGDGTGPRSNRPHRRVAWRPGVACTAARVW